MYTSSEACLPLPLHHDTGPDKGGAKLERKLEAMYWEEGGVMSQVRNLTAGDRDKHSQGLTH